MGYSVDYIPSYKRNTRPRGRSQQRGKCKITVKDLKRQVRWNLDSLERDYVSVDAIGAENLIAALRLREIVTGYDRERAGMNALLMLRREAALESHKVQGRMQFDLADTVAKLRAYVGAGE